MPYLDFKAKSIIYSHHLRVPFRSLRIDEKKSLFPKTNGKLISDDNLIIHGDNLLALKALIPRYAGKIKCIYIDPPYNTGNESWKYNDRVNSPIMKEWFKQNNIGRDDLERHDKWLCMMWPRLQLLKELLSSNGVIFVSIDDNEQHHLRMIMDEIFGEDNFFAILTRKAMHTVRNSSKDFNLNTDYILVYGKNKNLLNEDQNHKIRYITDKKAYTQDDHDGRGRYKLDPIHARNYYEPYIFKFSNGIEWQAPEGSYPRYSKDKLHKMEKEKRIVFNKNPMAKRYLSEVQIGQPPDTLLAPDIVGYNKDGTQELQKLFNRGGIFPQPKPKNLIKFLMTILCDKNAIVLDSFAGSGTTAHAVLDLNKEDGGNRKFILVECEDYADQITAERVRRIIKGVSNITEDERLQKGLGGSFAYCTLGEEINTENMLKGKLPNYKQLAEHIFYTATGQHLSKKAITDNSMWFIGETNHYRVHLIYKPNLNFLRSKESALHFHLAEKIKEFNQSSKKVSLVFATAKYITQKELKKNYNIHFCQLPYDIHKMMGA